MMNYYVYLALARGRSDALLREAETAHRGKLARRYRQRAGASGASRSSRRPALPPAAARLDRVDHLDRPAGPGWPCGGPARRAARRVEGGHPAGPPR